MESAPLKVNLNNTAYLRRASPSPALRRKGGPACRLAMRQANSPAMLAICNDAGEQRRCVLCVLSSLLSRGGDQQLDHEPCDPAAWPQNCQSRPRPRSRLAIRVSTSHSRRLPGCVLHLFATASRASDVGLSVALPAHADSNILFLFSFRRRDGAARQDRTVDLSLTKGVLYH